MTVYAPNDFCSINVSPGGDGGCGRAHLRDVGPDQPWAITCDGGCEEWLLAHDNRIVKHFADIPPTYDEKKALERFKERGQADKDAVLVLALSRMAGLSPAEIPPTLTKMLTGLPAHVAGVTVCERGHDNMPGSRFCRECGTAMARPAVAGQITSGAAA
jgi:hypothetical protein